MRGFLTYTIIASAAIALVCYGTTIVRSIRSVGYWIIDVCKDICVWIKNHRTRCWDCGETKWTSQMYKKTNRCKACVHPQLIRFDQPRPMIVPPSRQVRPPRPMPVAERVLHKPELVKVEPPAAPFTGHPTFYSGK